MQVVFYASESQQAAAMLQQTWDTIQQKNISKSAVIMKNIEILTLQHLRMFREVQEIENGYIQGCKNAAG